MYFGIYVKYPLFFTNFNEIWISQQIFEKILNYQNFMKIRPVGAQWTNRHNEANSRLSQFCERA
jgi:hypothetical protein